MLCACAAALRPSAAPPRRSSVSTGPARARADADTSATADDFCGAATTNLCHTAYVDQDHTLTYTLTDAFYVSSVTIHNKPNNADRLRNYTISVGDSIGSLAVCASGYAVEGVDVYEHACGLTGRFLRLTVDNEGDTPFNLREVVAKLHEGAPAAMRNHATA